MLAVLCLSQTIHFNCFKISLCSAAMQHQQHYHHKRSHNHNSCVIFHEHLACLIIRINIIIDDILPLWFVVVLCTNVSNANHLIKTVRVALVLNVCNGCEKHRTLHHHLKTTHKTLKFLFPLNFK